MSAAELDRPLVRRCAWRFRQSRLRIDRACDGRTLSSESEYAAHCSFGLLLGEKRWNQVRGHWFEMRRLHRITGTAFRERTNCGCVTKQFGKRNLRVDDCQITACLDAVNAAAPSAQISANVALKFLRGDVFHLHDRLEQNRLALFEAVFHGEDRCQLKR